MARRESGRMRIERLGLQTDETVAVRLNDGRLIFERRQDVLERLQRGFDHIPRTRSLAKELLAERRREARREAKH